MPSVIPVHLLVLWLSVHRLVWCTERASARERFKVVIAPLVCKRICLKGQCQDTCEQGNNTTLIAENGQGADTLIGQGFRVVCPLTCLNGGVCVSRKHCLCPPGFTGRLCQFPLQQTHRTQAARGNKQPRTQMTQTHSVFTLPIAPAGHPSSEQINLRVHHTPGTSVVIQPLDQAEPKPPVKTSPRVPPSRHKPKGRCFQETTPKQACNSTPLPVLTNQEDCCGTVGNSWGQNKCYQCPKLPIVEEYGSTCPQGYKRFNSTHCQINECTLQGVCQNGDCLNTLGSFKCSCKTGYVLLGQCFLMASESGCEHALPNHLTLKMCCCTVGKAWGHNCEWCPQEGTDTDECRLSRNICGHGECENSLNGHICHCHPGYHLNPLRNICEDNECESEPCGHGRGYCINVEGSYKCHCRQGYKHMVQHGRLKCVVNECARPDICGLGGHCVNLPGSYKCECQSGFKSKSHRHPAINECLNPDTCPNEQCENTPGSYECVPCLPGHEAQGGIINECQKPGICPNGRCENLPGTYRCLCNEGFLPSADSKGCSINECEDSRLCAYGRCINTEGSFQCQCYPGYQRTQEGSHCEINECERPSNCQRGHCINSMGSYHCECPKGFTVRVVMDEKKECYLNLDDTVFCDSVLATNVTKQECCCSIGVGWGDHCEIYPCPVSHSEFHSLCPNGQGLYFEEIDECALFAEEICKKGRCENTLPGYECYCQQGFYYDSNLLECIVNECHDESLCTNGHCVNTDGSFFCKCNLPWTPDANKKKCVIEAVAECQDPANCKNGHCVDTPGSYYCICSPPWTLATDRNSCVTPEEQASVVPFADVNECQDPSYCKNGRCENTPGSFHCFCDPPFTFSAAQKQCVYDDRTAAHKDVCFLQVDEGLICSEPRNGMVTYSECCCHYGRGWGPECNTCPQRHSMFNRLCEMHLETESDGEQDFLAAFANYNPDSSEEDSDECSCANGRCVRSYLGTMCECNSGFRLDHSRTRCIIDECGEPGVRLSPCKNARCVNTAGSYKCYCKHGFVPTRRPNICIRRRSR
uniref:Uncharacterized protein n=1 Tax=Periophthalmus magnuspinnatus TaxID=409849 RepID=A0A3B4B7A0_9GOBI